MAVDKDKVISEFGLKFSGQKGWMIGSHSVYKCPKCGNDNPGKLAVLFGEQVASWKCVKCSAHMRLEVLLWKIGKKELISKYKDIDSDIILEKRKLITEKIKSITIEELPKCSLPILFKRIYDSEYLNSRGCTESIYKNWTIGVSNFDEELKNYIIFVIKENNINVGWVARSILSKEEIDLYNEENKKKILRWRNSGETDFSKIVFGLEEINENTETVICQEGITSKLNTDIKLNLFSDDFMKCICTFGKKISDIQIKKIFLKGPNIKNFILFYDPDAVNSIREYSFLIQEVFPTVLIAFNPIKKDDGNYKDAGDMNLEEFNETFDNLKTPFYFWNNQLPIKKLKSVSNF